MKIAMFTDYFYPELGGIQDSVAAISRALGRRGHNVEIHAPRYGRRDYRRIRAEARERDLGENVRVIRRMSVPFPSSTRQSRAALPSPVACASLGLFRRPDVIHSHSFFAVGLDALLAGAWHGIPVIGTNHTTIPGFGPYIPIRTDRAARFVMWYYNHCGCVTAPSRSVFAEPGMDRLRRRHEIVSNPIDTDLFCPIVPSPARSGLTVTYAGRLGPEKNIGVLLHALAILRARGIEVELAIAGHGSHEPALRALADRLNIAPHVRILGTLPQADLADLLRASDIFAMPSTSETQSMVLLQAMACGIPVAAANSRALPEFVDSSNGVLVDPHDPRQWADALSDLLMAPERRRRMGQAGRRSVEQYSTATITSRWETLYQSVIEGRPGA